MATFFACNIQGQHRHVAWTYINNIINVCQFSIAASDTHNSSLAKNDMHWADHENHLMINDLLTDGKYCNTSCQIKRGQGSGQKVSFGGRSGEDYHARYFWVDLEWIIPLDIFGYIWRGLPQWIFVGRSWKDSHTKYFGSRSGEEPKTVLKWVYVLFGLVHVQNLSLKEKGLDQSRTLNLHWDTHPPPQTFIPVSGYTYSRKLINNLSIS